jgi:hypothetical protein
LNQNFFQKYCQNFFAEADTPSLQCPFKQLFALFFIGITPEISGGGGLTEAFNRAQAPAVRFISWLFFFFKALRINRQF